MTFLERFAPWSDEQKEAAARALRLVQEQGLEVVRIAFADQHGLLRGKTLIAGEMAGALHNGCSITSSLFAKDTANRTVFPVWTRRRRLRPRGVRRCGRRADDPGPVDLPRAALGAEDRLAAGRRLSA